MLSQRGCGRQSDGQCVTVQYVTTLPSPPRVIPLTAPQVRSSKWNHCSTDIPQRRCAQMFAPIYETILHPSLTLYSPDRRGNTILITICVFNIVVLYPATKAYYMWRNRQRAKIWDAMTSEVSLKLPVFSLESDLTHCNL